MQERVRALNDEPRRENGKYVLYWAQMNRRVSVNQALVHAVTQANELGLPVLVYEGLTCSYPFANDRLQTFVLEGVPDTVGALGKLGIGYCFYLRRKRSDANDVLYRVAKNAAIVVTDDYPTFIAAKHNSTVPGKIGVAYHAVDASCIVPMSRIEKRQYAAYTIRPRIQKLLPEYLHPLDLPSVKHKWKDEIPPYHTEVTLESIADLVASCDIDHSVAPSTVFRGGHRVAKKRLDSFLKNKLKSYAEGRNQPAEHATSNLSPYLHFGHISALEIALTTREFSKEHKIGDAEYLEELIVRRELGFNFTRFSNFESLESLPDWAQATLRKHESDERPVQFTKDQMEKAETYDDLWNATQKELLLRGKIHGYYRMYWGKKIIEWSATPEEALETMIYLHDRYALDGRDPNTYTNVLWCFGLHDRPWFERPIFGQVRYMSYEGMKRKTNVKAYLLEMENLERTGKELIPA
ncbi:MAG: deoxyribodipyrimidine photo-lyase [Bryobacteraceae bacterium]|nr:deoxyribodipyrimidine photo-lyase [Bryobacteraceae bacterium]